MYYIILDYTIVYCIILYYIIHRVGEPTLHLPDVANIWLEIHAFWAPKRRTEPRIGENCTARRDECNGGNENARNSSEILVKCLQRQVFAKSVPPPYELTSRAENRSNLHCRTRRIRWRQRGRPKTCKNVRKMSKTETCNIIYYTIL